jgi:LPS-assembly lipoprotein
MGIGSLCAVLGGCGFRPIYAPASAGSPSAASGLASVYVTLMPERSGQLMRDALQRRMELGGGGAAKLYNLAVSFTVAQEGASIERADSIATRTRAAGIATWSLTTADAEQRTVLTGRARSLDGNNPLSLQYFYSDLQGEQLQARLVEAVADQITTAIATWFVLHPPAV